LLKTVALSSSTDEILALVRACVFRPWGLNVASRTV